MKLAGTTPAPAGRQGRLPTQRHFIRSWRNRQTPRKAKPRRRRSKTAIPLLKVNHDSGCQTGSVSHLSCFGAGSELPDQNQRASNATYQTKPGGIWRELRGCQHCQSGNREKYLSCPDSLHARLPGHHIHWTVKAHQQREHQTEKQPSSKITGFE